MSLGLVVLGEKLFAWMWTPPLQSDDIKKGFKSVNSKSKKDLTPSLLIFITNCSETEALSAAAFYGKTSLFSLPSELLAAALGMLCRDSIK